MPDNPFWEAAENAVRGERVRVITDDTEYEGLAAMFNYNEDAILLRDVTRADGETMQTVMVRSDFTLEQIEDTDGEIIKTVAVDDIVPLPYSQRDFSSPDFAQFVRQVRKHGGVGNLPLVRPHPDETDDATYQVVSGHKRLEALKRAGVTEHPVRVQELTDWEVTVRFIDEHFPITDDERDCEHGPHRGWYSPALMQAAYHRLREDWSRDELLAHPAIEMNQAIVEAADGAAEEVNEILTKTLRDSSGEGDTTPEEDFEDVLEDLVEETGADEETLRSDLSELRGHEVPLGAAKGALRRKYE